MAEAQQAAAQKVERADVPAVGPGARRAAAVLLGLGPEVAGPLFRLLGEGELRQLALGSRQMRKGAPAVTPEAVKQFIDAMGGMGVEAAAGGDLLREFAAAALSTDQVRRAFDGHVPQPSGDEALGVVATAEPESLAMILVREQPQTVALVLASLDGERSAAVLQLLPEKVRAQVLWRMASIESVAPEVLREVGQALGEELRLLTSGGMRKVDGRSAALELLRRSSGPEQGEIILQIEKEDSALAGELRSKLFTFDDLRNLSDRDLQAVLKEIDSNQLVIALKGAAQSLREKFLKNMSSRAATMFADDLAAMGAVKLAMVEKAQAEIAAATLQLAENGKITIVRATDKMV